MIALNTSLCSRCSSIPLTASLGVLYLLCVAAFSTAERMCYETLPVSVSAQTTATALEACVFKMQQNKNKQRCLTVFAGSIHSLYNTKTSLLSSQLPSDTRGDPFILAICLSHRLRFDQDLDRASGTCTVCVCVRERERHL
jgi:hypothetical protein